MSLEALVQRTYTTKFGNEGTIELSPSGDSIQVYWSQPLTDQGRADFNHWALLVEGLGDTAIEHFDPPPPDVPALVPGSFYVGEDGIALDEFQVLDGGTGTPWTAGSDSAWVTVVSPTGTMTGDGVVQFEVDAQANGPQPERDANINVPELSLIFPIHQAAGTPGPPPHPRRDAADAKLAQAEAAKRASKDEPANHKKHLHEGHGGPSVAHPHEEKEPEHHKGGLGLGGFLHKGEKHK